MAERYWGTRTTWKRRWPCVAVALAFVYVLRRPLPAPVACRVSVPPPTGTAPVARTYSYLPELLRLVEPLALPPATPSP